MKLKLLVAVFLLAVSLVGCSHPEATVPTTLVINGTAFPNAATLHGAGYSVNANTLVSKLGGKLDVVNDGTVLVTLNGQRVLLSSTSAANVAFDHHVQAPVEWLNKELQLYESQLKEIMRVSFPGGRAYREGGSVFVETHPIP